MIDLQRLEDGYERVKQDLLAERTSDGHWVGELSTSALSTATAISALSLVRCACCDGRQIAIAYDDVRFDALIEGGAGYLAAQQNYDGGFGDTDKSHSNIATTLLVVAALHLAGQQRVHTTLLSRAEKYIDSQGRLDGLRKRYGKDKTFVVPIMTNLALAGLCDWKEISPLPFELACVPQAWYRFVGMPVVSYAIPALVAIGQAIYTHRKPWNPLTRVVRALSMKRSLGVLQKMQPQSGGYLEATPLTSFVVMSLASVGHVEHPVTRAGVKFLADSVRPDGSWPIDTNLATWVTTLSMNAFATAGEDVAALLGPQCLDWLLSCQHLQRHPFTGADPGGFGWSDLSGAVPDADDTPSAILALRGWQDSPHCTVRECERIEASLRAARRWLKDLRNRDRGWPTFCRGWGSLPFDRSGNDLTAHACRALHAAAEATDEAADPHEHLSYLASHQNADGSWSPLWFGNQDHPDEDNPVYGTSKVLFAYRDLDSIHVLEARRGLAWLVRNQNPDGGWGGSYRPNSAQSPIPSNCPHSSIEETALAVEALLAGANDSALRPSIESGVNWLLERIEQNTYRECSPIGFYFAKLWYYEKLYPIIFTLSALGHARRTLSHRFAEIAEAARPGP